VNVEEKTHTGAHTHSKAAASRQAEKREKKKDWLKRWRWGARRRSPLHIISKAYFQGELTTEKKIIFECFLLALSPCFNRTESFFVVFFHFSRSFSLSALCECVLSCVMLLLLLLLPLMPLYVLYAVREQPASEERKMNEEYIFKERIEKE
jgi:hypothetical protein